MRARHLSRSVVVGVIALGLGCGQDAALEPIPTERASASDAGQGGSTAWVRQLGGTGYEGVEAIAPAPDGGAVVITRLGRTGPFGAAPASIGLVRLRLDRTIAWSREFPVAGAVVGRMGAAVTGQGNVLLLMAVRCDAATCPDLGGGRPSGGSLTLLARYDPRGAFVWQRVVDAMGSTRVAVDASGSAAFAAARDGTGPSAGARLLKFRWDGAPLWDIPAPSVNDGVAPAPSAVGFDPAGNLAVGDRLAFYSLDPAGHVRWTGRLAAPDVEGWIPDIEATSAGTVVAVAQPTSVGTLSWAGTSYTAAQGGPDIAPFLAVADAGGAPRLGRVLPAGYQVGGASVDPAGRVAIVYQGTPGWLLESWTPAGDRAWARTFDGSAGAMGWSGVATDPRSHHVRLAGNFSGTIDLGTGPLTSRGDWDDVVLDVQP